MVSGDVLFKQSESLPAHSHCICNGYLYGFRCRRVCCQKLETLISRAKTVRANLSISNIREKLRQIHDILTDLEHVSFEVITAAIFNSV